MTEKGKKIGLALSGGGYRAAAYHIGMLMALRKLGILDKVDVISSISGGSITAAYYALHKEEFEDPDNFAKPLQKKLQHGPFCIVLAALVLYFFLMCVLTCGLITVWRCEYICICVQWLATIIYAVLVGAMLYNHNKWFSSSRIVQWYYDKHFFEKKKLKDLPDSPLLAINATEVSQNQLLTFSKLKVACGKKYEKGTIIPDDIPISLAVMASSAYPLFSPVTISNNKYFAEGKKEEESPILIDGGIYDNQGLHKLNEGKSDYRADFSIVSNAGVAEMSNEGTGNVLTLLYKVMELLMNRIEKMQMRSALYEPIDPLVKQEEDTRCAYVALLVAPLDTTIEGYLDNIRDSVVPQYVYKANGISEEQAERLRSRKMTNEERKECAEIVKKHIKWDEELHKNLDAVAQAWARAKSVGTNLKGLKRSEINALITLAEWQTKLQVRLHLPHLCKKRAEQPNE